METNLIRVKICGFVKGSMFVHLPSAFGRAIIFKKITCQDDKSQKKFSHLVHFQMELMRRLLTDIHLLIIYCILICHT